MQDPQNNMEKKDKSGVRTAGAISFVFLLILPSALSMFLGLLLGRGREWSMWHYSAIPATIAYNTFLGMINTVQSEMECFASEFLNRAQLELPWMNKRGE